MSFSDTSPFFKNPHLLSEKVGNHLQEEQLICAFLRYPHLEKPLSLLPPTSLEAEL